MQIQVVAVGWQMYEITASALSLGLIGLVQFIPHFLLVLPGGHAADRYDRRRIALTCQVIQLGIAATLAVASAMGNTASLLIYACSFTLGTAQAFQSPSIRSLLPLLVRREELPSCIAWSSATRKFAVVAGPALGGLIYLAGPSAVYGTSAICFALAAALLGRVRAPRVERSREPVTVASMFRGLGYIRAHPVILGAISLDLFAVLLGGATALLPIYAKDILLTGPWGLGVLRSAPAIGAIIVSAWLVRKPIERRVGPVMFGCTALFGTATIVFGLSQSFALSIGALMVLGAADMVSVVIRTSLIQLDTPDEMRGRVVAVNSMFTNASNQLGQFESGLLAAWIGTVPSVVVGGIGTLLVAAVGMRVFPALLRRERLAAS